MARRCRTCFSSEGFWILTTTTPTGTEEAGWEAERAGHTAQSLLCPSNAEAEVGLQSGQGCLCGKLGKEPGGRERRGQGWAKQP